MSLPNNKTLTKTPPFPCPLNHTEWPLMTLKARVITISAKWTAAIKAVEGFELLLRSGLPGCLHLTWLLDKNLHPHPCHCPGASGWAFIFQGALSRALTVFFSAHLEALSLLCTISKTLLFLLQRLLSFLF